MKKLTTTLAAILILVLFVNLVRLIAQQAQPATAVQQTATRVDSSSICGTAASTAGTITWTPGGSQYVYVTSVDFENGQNTTGIAAAAGPTSITISNIVGSPQWAMASGATTTPGTNTQTFSVFYPTGLKSQTPRTAVTITLPTIPTNTFMRVNACAYIGY